MSFLPAWWSAICEVGLHRFILTVDARPPAVDQLPRIWPDTIVGPGVPYVSVKESE